MANALAQIVNAAAAAGGKPIPESVRAAVEGTEANEAAQRLAQGFVSGERCAVLLGNLAQHHPQAATLHALAQALADITGARLGVLSEAANSVGGYVAGAVPFGTPNGKNVAQMLVRSRCKAYLLLGVEADLDTHDRGPHARRTAASGAGGGHEPVRARRARVRACHPADRTFH